MLIVHHLGVSQCERILWLCEELGVEYKMIKYNRDPLLSPKSLNDVPGNDLGQSPFVEDTDHGVKFSESAACVEWIIAKHSNGKLALKPDDQHFADYLQWFHYSNGTLQPAMLDTMFLTIAGIQPDSPDGTARASEAGCSLQVHGQAIGSEQIPCWARIYCRRYYDVILSYNAALLGAAIGSDSL